VATLRTIALLAALAYSAATQPADEPVLRVPFLPGTQLVYKVEPVYPEAAVEHRIQGTVRFIAVIGKKGNIRSLRLISGHPLLVLAARQAVRQWVYRPTLLGDKPVFVLTTV
jgi:outer membrane biosynthesis protein TonB